MITQHLYRYFPVYLFSFVWILVISFVNLQYYNIHPVSASTLLILFSAIFSFIAGFILFEIFRTNKSSGKYAKDRLEFDTSFIIKLIFFFFFLNITGSFMIMLSIGEMSGEGLKVYLQSPVKVRMHYVEIINDPSVHVPIFFKLGNYFVNASFAANILGGILLTTHGKRRLIGLVPLLAGIIASIAILGRYSFVNSVGFTFLCYLITTYFYSEKRRKLKLKQLFFFTILISASTYILFYSILSIRIVTDIDVQEYFNKTLYFYFSGGVAALDNFFRQDYMQLHYGLSSFRSIFSWLVKTGLWSENEIIYGLDSFTSVSPSLSINTYTYVKSLYLDFGILGVLFFSFTWGASVNILLVGIYNHFSLPRLFWTSIFIFGSLMTFYSFYFQSVTQIVFWFIPVFIVHYFFSHKIYKLVPNS